MGEASKHKGYGIFTDPPLQWKIIMAKILLVEDDKSLREIYGVRLMAEGYEIVSAGDGEEALAMAIKERPQLIVSDVMMPKISGFDMLDILRSTSETKDIKVIMMTALSSEDQRARGESLGADRYLVKSQVGIEDVVRTVHEVLGDSVATPATASQAFAAPTPAPAPVPGAPIAPSAPAAEPITTPTPAVPLAPSIPPTPAAPIVNEPVVQPTVAPVPGPAAAQPLASPAPTDGSLPQPTAPFSSPRPASLGDRVINPLNQPAEGPKDMAALMDQELNSGAAPAIAPVQDAPAAPTPPMSEASQPPAPATPEAPITPELDDTQLPPATPPAQP